MAKSQIEIDLKSTYDGEGFKKLDNDLKSAGQQTKRASEGLNKIATTLGSVDNAGVKAVGTISNLLGTLASFGLKGLVFGAIAAGIQKVINHFREMEERVKSVGQSMRTYLSTAFLDSTRQADSLLKKLKDVELAQKQKTEVKNINREAEYKVRQSQINLKYDKQKSNAKTENDRTEIELGRRRELLEARKEYEGTKARDNAEDIGNRMTQNEDKIKTLEDEKRKLQERLKPATQAEQAAQEIRNEQVALGKKIDVALERDNLARGKVEQSSVAEYMTADEKKEIYDSRVKNPLEAIWDAVKFWENEKQFENGSMVDKKVIQREDEYGNDVTEVIKDNSKDERKNLDEKQVIKQTLEPVDIPEVEDKTQNIKQTLEPVDIPDIKDEKQTIRQTLIKEEKINPTRQYLTGILGERTNQKKSQDEVIQSLMSQGELPDIIDENTSDDQIRKIIEDKKLEMEMISNRLKDYEIELDEVYGGDTNAYDKSAVEFNKKIPNNSWEYLKAGQPNRKYTSSWASDARDDYDHFEELIDDLKRILKQRQKRDEIQKKIEDIQSAISNFDKTSESSKTIKKNPIVEIKSVDKPEKKQTDTETEENKTEDYKDESRALHDINVGLNGTPIAARLGKKLLDKTTERQWLKFEEQRRRAYKAFQSTWSKYGGDFVETDIDIGSKAYTDTMLEWSKTGRNDYGGSDFLQRYKELGGTKGKTYQGARSGRRLDDVIHGFSNDKQFRKELQQLGKQSRKYFKIDRIFDDAVRGLTFGRMTDRKVVETQQVLDGFNSVANPTNKQLHNLETLPAKGKRLVEKVADSKPAQAIGKAIKSPVGRVVTKVGGKALAAVNVADTAVQSTKVGYESEKWIEQLSQESNTDELLKKYQDNEERIKRLEISYKNNAEVDNLKKRLEKINNELKAAVEKKKTFGVEQTKIEAERKVTQAEISRDEYNLMTEEDKQDALTPVKQGSNLRIDKASMDRYMQSTPQSDAEEKDDQRIRLAEGLDKINSAEYEFNQMIEQGDKEQKKSNLNKEQKTLEQKYLENLKKQLDKNLKSVLEISPAEYSKLDLDKINSAIDIEAIKAANDTVITAMQNAAKAWQDKANQIGQLNMPEYQQGQRDAGNKAGKEADKRIKHIANAAGNRAALANRIFDNDGNIRKSATPTDIENFNNTTDYMDKAMGQDMTDEQRDKTKKIKDNLARLVLDKNGNIKKSANMANVRQYLAAKGMLENEGKAKKAAEAAQREKERMEQENNQNLRMIKDKLDNLGM